MFTFLIVIVIASMHDCEETVIKQNISYIMRVFKYEKRYERS